MLLLSAGKNDHYQLGNHGSSGKAFPILNPRKGNSQLYELEDEIACFSAGRSHNVVVLKNGLCYGWGCNMLYEIGLPKQEDYPLPTLISFRSFLSKYFFKEPFIIQALCGHSFTLYLDKSGIVYLAKGNTEQCSLDKINFSKEEIVSIHGYTQPCIIGKSGIIYTINDDLTAQPIPFIIPEKNDDINIDPNSKIIIDVCITKKSIICLTKNGKVYILNTFSGTLFTLANSLLNEKVIKVLGKTNNFFALSESGKVFIYNSETEGNLFSLVEFPENVKITDFSIGFDFTCFIDSNNLLWCTGSKSFSSLIGISKNSKFNKPEKSTLIEGQKYKAIKVHCGYSHLLILAKYNSASEEGKDQNIIAKTQKPLSSTPSTPQTNKTESRPSSSRFRFPFFSSPILSTESTEDKNNDNDDNSEENSEINLQNYEILNKIKQITNENDKLMKEIEQLKNEKIENKKENQISDLQNENNQLKEENERLQNLIQTLTNSKKGDKGSQKPDKDNQNSEDNDCFGYKIDDACNMYFCDKYVLKPTESIKIFDRKEFIEDFHIIKKTTNYNEYKGMSKTYKISLNNFYAIKILNFTEEDFKSSHLMFKMLKLFLREYEIMLYNLHPCILKTYGFNFGDQIRPPSMLLEYCPLNLKEAAIKMKKARMVRIIVEIAYGMRFLHSNQFIHKNLKPENILIDKNWNSKIAGFDHSLFLLDDRSDNIIDSSEELIPTLDTTSDNDYLAPEIFDKNIKNTEKVDVYSFGILILFILTRGEYPNIQSSEENEIVKINDKTQIVIPSSINENAKNLVISCCNCDPDERPTFNHILSFLKEKNYKIISNFDSDLLRKRITEIELCEQS